MAALVEMLGGRVAEFHAHAQRGDPVTEFGRFEVVARNARENFEQSEPQVGSTISRSVFERLRALTEERLSEHRGRIEDRAVRHVPCDTHGDLRLDHVYYFPDQPPPSDLVIVDCIEFNERFRYADPVADMAFLVMDLARSGRRDLARAFADAYFAASGDADGRALLPFYTAYRAAVRGKVEGIEVAETEVPEPERVAARERRGRTGCSRSGNSKRPSGGLASSWWGASPVPGNRPSPAASPSVPASPSFAPMWSGRKSPERWEGGRPTSRRGSTRPSGPNEPITSACAAPRRSCLRVVGC